MKRLMIFVLALLCLALAATAIADTGATLVRESLKNTEWIDGTNRLRVEGDPINNYRAYSMNTLDGTQLTEAIYGALSNDNGYVIATSLLEEDLMNAEGLLDIDGNEVLPYEYGDIDVFSSEWAVGVRLLAATDENYDYRSWFSDAKYLIDTVDVYHLPEGKKLATLSRSEYGEARAVNHCINIENRTTGTITTYDAEFNALGTVETKSSSDYAPADYQRFYEDRHYGIKDAQGNVLLEPTYASIRTGYQGTRPVSADNGKMGLITEQGALVIPAEYDNVISSYYLPEVDGEKSGYIAAGYVAVEIGDKLGYVDINGKVTCESKYIANSMNVRGATATIDDPLTGNMIMVAADGVETVVEGYAYVFPLSYSSGMYYRVVNDDNRYGMIDWHGDVILPCEYRDIDFSGDGRYLLAKIDYSTADLYELTYPEIGAAVIEQEETESEQIEQESAPAGDSPVATLVANAVSLLNADATGNKDAAIQLLQSAVTLLGSENEAAVNMLGSAITLLSADAAANATAIATLLDSAVGLL